MAQIVTLQEGYTGKCLVVHENLRTGKEGRKCLFNDALNTFYFTVIWRRTYGKGPLR